MKKKNLKNYLLKTSQLAIILSLGMTGAWSSDSDMDLSSDGDNSSVRVESCLSKPAFNFPRVKQTFDLDEFLRKCDRENNTDYLGIRQRLIEGDPFSTVKNCEVEVCWRALFNLKDKYKIEKDWDNYTFTYQSMTKLLLAHDLYPESKKTHKKKNDFINSLINKIGKKIVPESIKKGKLNRWFHIYEAMLLLKFVNDFNVSDEQRFRGLKNAFSELKKAENLKTTKTVYYMMAEMIVDHDFRPGNCSKEEAFKKAESYIKKAAQKERRKNPSLTRTNTMRSQSTETVVEKTARPTYVNEIEGASFQNAMENLDSLTDEDFDSLTISQHASPHSLPVGAPPLNTVRTPSRIYTIKGRNFKRQNVSGRNMRCFFNAAGLDPATVLQKLRNGGDEIILRHMIANEIVASALNPEQISESLKCALDYEAFKKEQDEIDGLKVERNDFIRRQSSETMPVEFNGLDARETHNFESLRKKARTKSAYQAFLEGHIDIGEMMVTLIDVRGDIKKNLSSVDAAAFVSNIGIEIYTPNATDQGSLRLTHAYIPPNADKVAYLFHQGTHFQALLPDDRAELNSNSETDRSRETDNGSETEPEIDPIASDNDEMDLDIDTDNVSVTNLETSSTAVPDHEASESKSITWPSDEDLKKLYPDAEMPSGHKKYTASLARKILYAYEKITTRRDEIAKLVHTNSCRVSRILNHNNIQSAFHFTDKQREIIVQAYLENYHNIKVGKVKKVDLSKKLSKNIILKIK